MTFTTQDRLRQADENIQTASEILDRLEGSNLALDSMNTLVGIASTHVQIAEALLHSVEVRNA